MARSSRSADVHGIDPTALGRRFRRRLKSGRLLLGGIVCEYLRPSLVKLYRQAGFDFLYIEAEHTMPFGPALADFIQSARDNGMPVISKVGTIDRGEVTRLLDAGVVGIQLPRTESRSDVERMKDLMTFPPGGTRPGEPILGNVDYAPPTDCAAWQKKADASVVFVAHIETRRGYESAEEIVTSPGVDMVYAGP